MNKLQIVSIAMVALALLSAFYAYPLLPDRMPSHWDISGHVDGYSDRLFGAFLLPTLCAGLLVLFWALPKLDPLKKNYAAFRTEYDGMVAAFLGFMCYLYLLTILAALGYSVGMTRLLSPAFAVLFFYIGVLLSKAKQNWFVGIRTPWTLSDERVWDKTHKLASKLFKAAGVAALLGVLDPLFLLASVAILIAAALLCVVYSYVEFQKRPKPAPGKKTGRAHRSA